MLCCSFNEKLFNQLKLNIIIILIGKRKNHGKKPISQK